MHQFLIRMIPFRKLHFALMARDYKAREARVFSPHLFPTNHHLLTPPFLATTEATMGSNLWVYVCTAWVSFGGILFGWDSSYVVCLISIQSNYSITDTIDNRTE